MRLRAELSKHTPVHITLRVVKAVGRLRRRAYHAIRRAIATTWEREDFRVVHVSIQREHIHLICEADNKAALGRGMKGLEVSAAKQLNAAIALDRGEPAPRKGRVFPERYHVEPLTSPRQVRNVIAYCLNNWRRHREDLGSLAKERALLDPYSSAVTFDGWNRDAPFTVPDGYEALGTMYPQTWLLEFGWRKYGRIDPREVPGPISLKRSSSHPASSLAKS